MGIESEPRALLSPPAGGPRPSSRNKLGSVSLAIAIAGLIIVEFQVWLDLDSLIIFRGFSLKGLLAAFFEASTVGALADWFAVTALFKNPLGIKLPHTDIIAKNKDAIANAVPRFLSGFVSPSSIRAELGRVDFAARIADALEQSGSRGEMRDFLRRRVGELLVSYRGGEGRGAAALRVFVSRLLDFASERVDAPAALAGILTWARSERFDERIIDLAAEALRDGIGRNRVKLIKILTPILKANSGWQGLFLGPGTVERALAGAQAALTEIKNDKGNDARRFIVSSIAEAAERLAGRAPDFSGDREKLSAAFKAAIADELFRDAAAGFVGKMLAILGDELSSPDSAAVGALEGLSRSFADRIRSDELARRGVNEAVASIISTIVERGKVIEDLTEYLAGLLRSTDRRFFVGRIEDAVWNDLQYIRVNGAVVGGLVGLVIALIKAAFA